MLKIAVMLFFNEGKSFFHGLPFQFYDICKKVRVDSGCEFGKYPTPEVIQSLTAL